MAVKRFAEYRMIGNPELAGRYRKSFLHYTEKSLTVSSFLYAMAANFLLGIFLIKYRVELILFVPFFMGLFCYYFWIAFDDDSAVQKPEKLFREKGLMIYLAGLVFLFVVLVLVDVPQLEMFTNIEMVPLRGQGWM